MSSNDDQSTMTIEKWCYFSPICNAITLKRWTIESNVLALSWLNWNCVILQMWWADHTEKSIMTSHPCLKVGDWLNLWTWDKLSSQLIEYFISFIDSVKARLFLRELQKSSFFQLIFCPDYIWIKKNSFLSPSMLVINNNFIWKFLVVSSPISRRLWHPPRSKSAIHYNEWSKVFINTYFELSTPDKTVKVRYTQQQHGTKTKKSKKNQNIYTQKRWQRCAR